MLIIEIINTSGLAPISDYDYKVKLNYTEITSGSVSGHTRKDGWIPLVEMILKQEIENNIADEELMNELNSELQMHGVD